MAGKPKPMSQIKQLLRLKQQGQSIKQIARVLSVSKNTVKAYLEKTQQLPYSSRDLLSMEDNELESKLHDGDPAYKDERYEQFKSNLGYYAKELGSRGVTKHLLWKEYRQNHPQGYGYSQFCHHLYQYLKAQHPTMVLQHTAGEKLYIDFAGQKLSYVDPVTAEIHYCEVFVACLPFSDYTFAVALESQQIADVIEALVRCLTALGGAPQVLVPDNFKAAVVKADRYEPTLNRAMEDLANHYQMALVPARSGKPQDKSSVENLVKILYSRVYAPLRKEQFHSLEELNEAIAGLTHKHNQTRMQQKPYSREEKFIADELPKLQELPSEKFELRYYKTLTVAKNNHICLGKERHYYSVPYQHIGQKVKVIYTRAMVYIYYNTNPIATHRRNRRKGGYTTEKNHLCSQHAHYLDRSPEYYLKKAGKVSDDFYELTKQLFNQDRYPEQLYRSCEGLLALQRKTDTQVFNKACQIALAHKQYRYPFIKKLIENNMTHQDELWEGSALPDHRNKRGKGYYQ